MAKGLGLGVEGLPKGFMGFGLKGLWFGVWVRARGSGVRDALLPTRRPSTPPPFSGWALGHGGLQGRCCLLLISVPSSKRSQPPDSHMPSPPPLIGTDYAQTSCPDPYHLSLAPRAVWGAPDKGPRPPEDSPLPRRARCPPTPGG